MTGPSLAGLWGRKAGSLPSFPRYSPALQASGIVWNDKSLDDWIKDPQHLMPDNDMTFEGIKDDRQRADLLAFLKQATQPGHASTPMGGMMGGGETDLKTVGPGQQVRAVTYCRDTFRVTTADGKTRAFWERNLRLKVDGSNVGPEKGAPALVGADGRSRRRYICCARGDQQLYQAAMLIATGDGLTGNDEWPRYQVRFVSLWQRAT
jgi:cytochrome c